MITSVFGVLFDGFAYGMLLFLLSVGLSVTLGMMNFVNLAHCSFAMIGGYVTVTLMNQPRVAVLRHPAGGLPRGGRDAAWCSSAPLPAALPRERSRPVPADHRHRVRLGRGRGLHLRHHPAAGAAADLSARLGSVSGPDLRRLPHVPDRRSRSWSRSPWSPRSNTRASARRCAPRSTTSAWRAGSASTSTASFAVTFALGSGLAGLGGALAIEIVGLDPSFAFAYLVYVLIVVAVGGLGSIGGSFAAAMLLGISDMAGKYYFPEIGSFLIYLVMISLLMWRPAGLFGRR